MVVRGLDGILADEMQTEAKRWVVRLEASSKVIVTSRFGAPFSGWLLSQQDRNETLEKSTLRRG